MENPGKGTRKKYAKEDEELVRLPKEVASLREDREILRKVVML